jgi:hypothetical protein
MIDCFMDTNKETPMDTNTTNAHGTLGVGDTTTYGTIQQVSLTAYLIAGTWYPFTKIHGSYTPVEPLVTQGINI